MQRAKRTTKVREVQVTGSVATPPHVATWESELFVRAILAMQTEESDHADSEHEAADESR